MGLGFTCFGVSDVRGPRFLKCEVSLLQEHHIVFGGLSSDILLF